MRATLAVLLLVAVAACNSSDPAPAPAGVTRIDAGPGLSGGPVTGTGTLRVAVGGVDASMIATGAVGPGHLDFDPATQLELDAHGHDTVYATIAHDHDAVYASVAHGHDAVYAAILHGHDAADILGFDAAAQAAMGPKAGSNPLNHDRYTDAEAVSAVAGQGAYLAIAGGTMTGPIDLSLHPPRHLRLEPAASPPATCSAGAVGAVYFDTLTRSAQLCDGATWLRLTVVAAGTSPSLPATSCAAIHQADASLPSGSYWLDPDGAGGAAPAPGYCEMTLSGGGWTLLQNSALGTETTRFWQIRYADRLGRRGTAELGRNFYDGSLYLAAREVLDVVEDLAGKQAVMVLATFSAFDAGTMRFVGPALLSGDAGVYSQHVASGWSSPDFDGDTSAGSNCATSFANVTQHYGACWTYSLGADGESPFEDGHVGPHVPVSLATSLGLTTDGSTYTRVRRITRFVR